MNTVSPNKIHRMFLEFLTLHQSTGIMIHHDRSIFTLVSPCLSMESSQPNLIKYGESWCFFVGLVVLYITRFTSNINIWCFCILLLFTYFSQLFLRIIYCNVFCQLRTKNLTLWNEYCHLFINSLRIISVFSLREKMLIKRNGLTHLDIGCPYFSKIHFDKTFVFVCFFYYKLYTVNMCIFLSFLKRMLQGCK